MPPARLPGDAALRVLPVALEALAQVGLVDLHAVACRAAEWRHRGRYRLEHAVAHEPRGLQAHPALFPDLAQRAEVDVALGVAHPGAALELRGGEHLQRRLRERVRAAPAEVSLRAARRSPAFDHVPMAAPRALLGRLAARVARGHREHLLVDELPERSDRLPALFLAHLGERFPCERRHPIFHAVTSLSLMRPLSWFLTHMGVPQHVHIRIHSGLTPPLHRTLRPFRLPYNRPITIVAYLFDEEKRGGLP